LDVGLVNKPTLNLVDEQVRIYPCQASRQSLTYHTHRRLRKSAQAHSCLLLSPSAGRLGYVWLVIWPLSCVEISMSAAWFEVWHLASRASAHTQV
jgi:hypothetical protein